jgi:hypothetical protein
MTMEFVKDFNFEEDGMYVYNIHKYSCFLIQAVGKAIVGMTKLPKEIFELEGMSSSANRALLNNLCDGDGHYLEVGSWKGSTFISALFNNTQCKGVSIDSHKQFDNCEFKTTAEELEKNCKTNLTGGEKYTLLTADSFEYKFPADKKFDIYFYDGDHSYESQYKALTCMYDNLQPFFYYICDDYSLNRCEKGTKDALQKLNLEVITEFKLYGNQGIPECRYSGFWNGFYVAFCVKKDVYPQHFNEHKYTHYFSS